MNFYTISFDFLSSILIFAAKSIDEKVNLIIEQGNTMLKIAVFEDGRITAVSLKAHQETSGIWEMFDQYQPEQGIMSSVTGRDESLIRALQAKMPQFIWLDEKTPVPVRIEYETINTLGKDRIAAVAGASYLQPRRNCLVIDAGTAITYELLTAEGIYKGGNISPGMTTPFLALNHFTGQLPLVKRQEEVPFIGTSTESAILAGVVNGIVYEMDGYIEAMKSKFEDIFVFLTGGHANYFEKRLKNHIFAEPNLLLIGLNRILEYNA